MQYELRTLLVDDEPLALEYLSALLDQHAGVEVIGTCRNGREALKRLRQGEVDLVFLDIQMPGMTGLEVVSQLQSDQMPLLVFATAYDQYALEAFDLNAVDYLLKPFDPERVEKCLGRVLERWSAKSMTGDKAAAMAAIRRLNGTESSLDSESLSRDLGKLPIKDSGQTQLVDFENIEWIDAAGDYMCVHAEGQTHILRSTMKELEQRLPGYFVRIHRSTIVNLNKVRTVEALPKGESLLHLGDEVTLKVSRNFRAGIQHLVS